MFYDFTNHICIILVSRQPLYSNNLINYGNQENIQSKPGKQEVKLATCRLCNCAGLAFEWSKRDVRIDMSGAITENVFEQEIEIPITEQPELAAPPPPQAPAIAEVLTIVDDNDNVKETAIASSEEIGEAVIIKPISPTVDEEIPVEDEIFEVVEKNPEFSYNGMSLMQYLGKSIKYPTIAQETGTQGRVIVQFVVNKDGSIVDVKVVRGVDPYLDKEAIRVISTMPKWKPGEQRGKPVRCKFTVPVMFKLQ